MKLLKRWFLSGLLLVAPVGLTIAVIVWGVSLFDGALGSIWKSILSDPEAKLPFPGIGLLCFLALVLVVGLLTSNFLTKRLMAVPGKLFERLPLVKLLYSSIKDLFAAFVGDKKSFDKPVLVSLVPGSDARVLGFVTNEDLSALGLEEDVAVYLPQSYNFAGNVIIVPRDSVTPLAAESGEVMTFIVSGGVSSKKPEKKPAPAAG